MAMKLKALTVNHRINQRINSGPYMPWPLPIIVELLDIAGI